jgi:hypothetical protein
MPLLDHFRPPLIDRYPWVSSLLSGWTTLLADRLNERWLSDEFLAAEYKHVGPNLGVDVASFEVVESPRAWVPPASRGGLPVTFPDTFEVKVFQGTGGWTLVGAIEIVSPGNKDRADNRRAFATKCASYLYQGVSVVVIDVVTDRRANLHNETMRVMEAAPEWQLPPEVDLYAVAYRPVLRDDKPEIDVWTERCAVGSPLPMMPVRLTGDTFVPVDFEAAYQEACRKGRLL